MYTNDKKRWVVLLFSQYFGKGARWRLIRPKKCWEWQRQEKGKSPRTSKLAFFPFPLVLFPEIFFSVNEDAKILLNFGCFCLFRCWWDMHGFRTLYTKRGRRYMDGIGFNTFKGFSVQTQYTQSLYDLQCIQRSSNKRINCRNIW